MATKKRTTQEKEVQDYRHDTATRKNNPPAGIAAQGKIKETPKQEYAYNPHLPPNLRCDPNGDADKLPELLQIAQQRALTAEEAETLADALRHYDGPWLEWAGKQETKSFTVDPVALHIHERVSAKAILKVAERQNVQRELFADPQQDYSKAVDFYQHDVERCMLMTTDPGDLILDPTCGSGTTAYVAEQRGRRWITIDTSRVAIALAHQRLLTASYDYYELKDSAKGIAGGFINKTVPHITLRSIAQNTALDPIFAICRKGEARRKAVYH